MSSPNVVWHETLARRDREAALGLRGATVWLTGLSGSGKSTVAVELERVLVGAGRAAYVLDGDNLRHGLNGDLGFDRASRVENIRRISHVARLMADAGVVAIVPVISPYLDDRAKARAIHDDVGIPFVEVYVRTPIEVCERRDPKGLYAKARRGELTGFTGVDDPYEEPTGPELVVEGEQTPPERAAQMIVERLAELQPGG